MAITRCPIGGSQSSCRLDPAARRTPYHRSNKASSPCSASSKTRYSVLSNLLCSLGLREIHIKPYQYVLVVNHLINSPLLLLTSTKQLKAGDQSGKSHFNTYTTWARREGRDCCVLGPCGARLSVSRASRTRRDPDCRYTSYFTALRIFTYTTCLSPLSRVSSHLTPLQCVLCAKRRGRRMLRLYARDKTLNTKYSLRSS